MREQSWLQGAAKEADLEIDERLEAEEGSAEARRQSAQQSKRKLDQHRAALKGLLDRPVAVSKQSASHQKRGFVVFAK